MSRMNRAWIVAVLLLSGCSEHKETKESKPFCPPPAPRGITRSEGIVLTGLPDSPELAACDARGRWGLKTPAVEHSIIDPKEKAPLVPQEHSPRLTLFRDS